MVKSLCYFNPTCTRKARDKNTFAGKAGVISLRLNVFLNSSLLIGKPREKNPERSIYPGLILTFQESEETHSENSASEDLNDFIQHAF